MQQLGFYSFWLTAILSILLSCHHQENLSPFENALEILQNKTWLNGSPEYHAEIAPYCSVKFNSDHTYELSPRGNCNTVWESGIWSAEAGARADRPSDMDTHLSPANEVILTLKLVRLYPFQNDSINCSTASGEPVNALFSNYWEITTCEEKVFGINRYSISDAPCAWKTTEYSLRFIHD